MWMFTQYGFFSVVAARDLASEIDYGNFKSRVHDRTADTTYSHALHDVWAVMERLQRSDLENPD